LLLFDLVNLISAEGATFFQEHRTPDLFIPPEMFHGIMLNTLSRKIFNLFLTSQN